jgi:hypothetical protein
MKLTELIVKLGDEYEDRGKFQELCRAIYRYLSTKKIKDLALFKQRTGTEYRQFYESLDYPDCMKEVLDDDEFFDLMLSETKKFKK